MTSAYKGLLRFEVFYLAYLGSPLAYETRLFMKQLGQLN